MEPPTVVEDNQVKYVPAGSRPAGIGRMPHPDPSGPLDRTPVRVSEIWENPDMGERAKILELPWHNSEGRVIAELTARVGSHVMGEHRHPALVERFTVFEGEITVKLNEETSILRQGESGCHQSQHMARLVECGPSSLPPYSLSRNGAFSAA